MATSRFSVMTLVAGLVAFAPSAAYSQSLEEKAEAYRAKVLAVSKQIDELIAAKQKEAGVTAAEKAGDGTYFRRVNIDLIGRIPTLLDIDDFLSDDNPDKRWTWVEKMLAHERNAPHLASVFRFQILGAPNQMAIGFQGPFEQFLRERFQKNVGYDKVVHEILTSGAGADPRFGGGGVPGGGANPSGFFFVNENKPESLAAATTRVFMGVKLECAQCHPHPFAKWTREQFWEMAAFYSARARLAPRVMVPGMPAVLPKPGEIEIPGTKKFVKAKFLDGDMPKMDDTVDPQRVLADWVVNSKNPFFAKATVDFLWSQFFGVSILEPIMEPSDDAPITHPEVLELLAKELVESNFDLKHMIRIMVHTEVYQRASSGKEKVTPDTFNLFVRMPVRGMTPEQLFDSVAEATDMRLPASRGPAMDFMMFPGGPTNPRAEFLTRFISQDRRHETQTSILQALYLMNGKFLNDRVDPSKNDALRTILTVPQPTKNKIRTLYMMVLSRQPRADELDRLAAYVESGGPTRDADKALTDVYWALLNCGEFMLNH